MDINRWMATGRLTRDPEQKVLNSGTVALEFGLAVEEHRRGQGGAIEKRAGFFECVIYGKRAQALYGILSKGMQVSVEAHLKYSSWQQDGRNYSRITAVVDDIVLPPKQRDGSVQPAQEYIYDDDIAF